MEHTSLVEFYWRRSDRVNCTEEQGSETYDGRHVGFIQQTVFPTQMMVVERATS